ncbi:MAG TPA: glycosyltransferase [Candidatus Binatia bacterium]|jgi:glycosyltransferase involved in cell wall biosynthesis|nr:glycosyltransferase [Candidatus Binatia bacterium]
MAGSLDSLPLVSIIVPVFNGERYLRESLDSILAQTYPRTEVLVMDDASTDTTPEIIASYANRVKYYRQSQNRGIYGNANDGITIARGEYVAVYHADDLYRPNIVEREVAFLLRYPKAGAAFCLEIFIDASGRERSRVEIPPEVRGSYPLSYEVIFNALLKYKNRFLCCPTSMVRASVYHEVGTYRDGEFLNSSDLEMWLRINEKYPIGILEEYLLRYRYGHGNSSQRYHHLRTDPERYFRIMDLYLENSARAIATPEALAAYEGHRAEDRLMRSVNHYIMAQLAQSQQVLDQVRPAQIFASDQIQSGRLLVLFLLLKILVCLPRIPFVAKLFRQRWHIKKLPRRSNLQLSTLSAG